jgi:trehalose 6-phosphate synthase
VQPFDLVGTAEVLHRALTMPADDRARRADALRTISEDRTPAVWLRDQLAAAEWT